MSTKHNADRNRDEQETTHDDRRRRFLDRRRFMLATGTAAGVALAGCTGDEPGDDDDDHDDDDDTDVDDDEPGPGDREYLEEKFPGLLIHSADPENAEAEFRETYTEYITPSEEHYIRNHYLAPQIEEDDWEISLGGTVEEEVDITMAELREEYSTETVTHVMQCSGNGRSYFDPEIAGNPWRFGAVGNAEWTGAPMSEVLEEYGADTSDGMWVMFAGDDHPEGEDVFARSIPMGKVMEDCILAYEMNGEEMTAEHGHPVRLVVPGWFGNNNVKWVAEIEVMERMMMGDDEELFHEDYETDDYEDYLHWQQNAYRILAEGQESIRVETIEEFDTREQMDMEDRGEMEVPPYIYDQNVKSLIGYPGEDDTVEPRDEDGMIEVLGVAWAGDDEVTEVEVSADGGETWENAEFFGEDNGPYAWRQFRYMWDPDEEGEYTLYSRATDELDRSQPRTVSDIEDGQITVEDDTFPYEMGGYCLNTYEEHGVDVTVEM